MKKIILLISSFLLVFSLTTCTKEGMEFDTNGGKGLSFVHFVGSKQTIAAKSSAYTSTITVSSTEKTGAARTYNLVVDPSSTAKEGTHFTLSSKTVTIPAGAFSGSVTVTANLKNLTPETVTAKISIDSNDAIDYAKTMTVDMYLFFEVTIDWLVGKWTWTDYYMGEVDEMYDVEIKKIDDKTIGIYNIWDGEMTIEATVDFTNAKIAIKPSQPFYDYWEDGDSYGYVYMDAATGSSASSYSRTEPIIGTCSYAGSISVAGWVPYLHDTGYTFGVVLTSILTKK